MVCVELLGWLGGRVGLGWFIGGHVGWLVDRLMLRWLTGLLVGGDSSN